MCLTDDKEPYAGRDLYLFNPSIQKYKKLSTEFSCYVDLLENVYKHYPVVGFGFYEPENDYRVVRIIYSGPRVRTRVEVYSLNSGKWRSVSVNVEHVASNNRNAFVDGCLHWLVAKTPRDRIEWVMSFDLKDEVVHEVEMPEDYDDDCLDDNVVMSIFNWNGSVGLCVFKSAGDLMQYLNCCFWEMNKDIDGNSSWERKFDFLMMDDPTGLVVGVSCSGKIVIDAFGERKLGERKRVKNKICALNPDDMEFKDLAVDGPYMVDSRFMESLVLLLD